MLTAFATLDFPPADVRVFHTDNGGHVIHLLRTDDIFRFPGASSTDPRQFAFPSRLAFSTVGKTISWESRLMARPYMEN